MNAIQTSIVRVGLVTTGILLIPFIGMQVGGEWNWDESDFIIMGILLSGTGFLIEFTRSMVKDANYRALLVIGIVLLCLYIWAELAVGIFTNWGS